MKKILMMLVMVMVCVNNVDIYAQRGYRRYRCSSVKKKQNKRHSAHSLNRFMDAQNSDIVPEEVGSTQPVPETPANTANELLVPTGEDVVVDVVDAREKQKIESAADIAQPEEVAPPEDQVPEESGSSAPTRAPEEAQSDEDFLDNLSEDGEDESDQPGRAPHETFAEQRAVTEANQPVEHDFDIEAKKQAVMELIDLAETSLKKNPIDQVFSAFSHDNKFVKGELHLFAFDNKGVCLAHGRQNELIWQNLYNLKDTYGTYIVREMLEKARLGGGWVTYQWRYATKVSYVKQVRKGDKVYTIGCGYYPHSKEDAVVNLVKGAVSLFNEIIKHGRPKDEAFSTFSYTMGRFTLGDLYLYALDFHGLQLAHGELPGVVGTSGWTYRDSSGKLVNQEIIAQLKNGDLNTGIWIDYISKNAPKRSYAEKVVDHEGNYYFIACGYYPDANRNEAVSLVRRAYRYMKTNGKSIAARAFTERDNNEFRYGDLYIVVYDLKGTCVAHGGNGTLVGKNLLGEQDSTGYPYVREIIKKAQAGGGWVDYKEKNSFKSTYVEFINMGTDKFVISCGLYPITKRETMTLIAKSGADYLRTHTAEEALREFVAKDGKFTRGDLDLFVYDTSGICLAYSDNYDLIWRNLMRATDQTGKPYVKMMINTVQRGPGTVTYRLHDAIRLVYVEPVEKDGKVYVVGSGFYF